MSFGFCLFIWFGFFLNYFGREPGGDWAKQRERISRKAANFSVCGISFNKVIEYSELILNEVKTAIAGNHKIFHCNPVWDPLVS